MKSLTRSLVLAPALLAAGAALASQNHLTNTRFNSSLAGWTQPAVSSLSRNWTNARGHDGMGAAAAYAGGATLGLQTILSQCIPVVDATYQFGVWFRWEPGFGGPPLAQLVIDFFDSADCSGAEGANLPPASSSTAGATAGLWQLLSANQNILGWNSVRIRLCMGVTAAHDAQGYFDDAFANQGVSGDANSDGKVDVSDVFYVVNHLFSGGPPPTGPCDVNNSDTVDVNDVFHLINYLFANGPSPL